jgi:hypothetical protein
MAARIIPQIQPVKRDNEVENPRSARDELENLPPVEQEDEL